MIDVGASRGGIDFGESSFKKDFGKGFYLSSQKERAIKSAKRFTSNPSVVEFNIPKKEFEKLNGLEFKDANQAWADFTRFHQSYGLEKLMHGGKKYDFVSGPLYKNAKSIKEGKFIIGYRVTEHQGRQTSIHTNAAMNLFNKHINKLR